MSALRKQRPVKTVSVCQEFIFPSPKATRERRPQKSEDAQKLLKYIDEGLIGKGVLFFGPFGRRKVVYANYSTSGRSLQFLEDYICKEVLPAFGDNSCSSSVTGLQSHLYDTESRDIIRHAVNASEEDEIVFCNNPSARLAYLFAPGLSYAQDENKRNRVVLFVSNLEPYKNIKTWLDAGVQVEKVEKNNEGFLDLVDLERKLFKHKESGCKLIGLFSTVSRLTGILADDVATTILLHQHGAISVWDFTASCSSAQINVNPEMPMAAKDAIFFNGCNMIGGVQAGGVLVVKKSIMRHCPSFPMEMINSVSIVRCGLVVQLKETMGPHVMARSEKICKQVLSHIRTIPEITLLGPASTVARRIPTVCFMIKHPRGTFLHHRFVVAILNDVFGIQSTASNLVHQTLGICDSLKVQYEHCISANGSAQSPGYTQLTFPFFMADAEIGFILEALKMVAQEGWKLLPQYEINSSSGEWRHLTNALAKERKWLHSIRYHDGRMLFSDRRISAPDRLPQNYGDCLQTARNIFSRARKTAQRSNSDDSFFTAAASSDQVEKLRWFILPREAHELLLGPSQNVKNEPPFDPKKLVERSLSLEVRRFQKSRSMIDSMQAPKSSPTPEKQHSIEFSSPPSPIVRFTLGGDTKCAMTSFSNHLTIPNRNRCHSWSSKSPPKSASILTSHKLRPKRCVSSQAEFESCSDTEQQEIDAYVKEVTREISDEIKSEIREVMDLLENSESGGDTQTLSGGSSAISAEDKKIESTASILTGEINYATTATEETKLDRKESQRINGGASVEIFCNDEKQRSDSLPAQLPPSPPVVYTGAISKLKSVTQKELSSQDSGINMNFYDDERRRARTFGDERGNILE